MSFFAVITASAQIQKIDWNKVAKVLYDAASRCQSSPVCRSRIIDTLSNHTKITYKVLSTELKCYKLFLTRY